MQETNPAQYAIQITVTKDGTPWLQRTQTGLTVENLLELLPTITLLHSHVQAVIDGSTQQETLTDAIFGFGGISKH